MDASDRGIGAILTQKTKVFGIYSYKLNAQQEKYTTSEKETLAIAKALQFFRNIVYGCKILIKTDHSNLQYLNSTQIPRLQRWNLI